MKKVLIGTVALRRSPQTLLPTRRNWRCDGGQLGTKRLTLLWAVVAVYCAEPLLDVVALTLMC
jgi:hypothetical protein